VGTKEYPKADELGKDRAKKRGNKGQGGIVGRERQREVTPREEDRDAGRCGEEEENKERKRTRTKIRAG